MNEEIPSFHFASGSSSFRMGDYGYMSDGRISLYATQVEGSIIASAIREVTFYNPGITGLYIGKKLVPERKKR